MGGIAKGLLKHPTHPGSIVDHVVHQMRSVADDVVLVGPHPAYQGLALRFLKDEMFGVGPAGGLLALLRYAGDGIALAVACDMPNVKSALFAPLLEGIRGGASVAVYGRKGRLEPFCAAYRAAEMLGHVQACLGRGTQGLHLILREARVVEIEISEDRAHLLDDWDSPKDIRNLGLAR